KAKSKNTGTIIRDYNQQTFFTATKRHSKIKRFNRKSGYSRRRKQPYATIFNHIELFKQTSVTRISTRQFGQWKNTYHQQDCRFNDTRRRTSIYKDNRKQPVQLGRV